ncbi:MAG TPA: hypothetical protein VL132_02855 [Planctomycetaceae bacterium]|nr:hypothetical protein [Planctomycetaceae bacterium]
MAEVHLTWHRETDPRWPRTVLFPNMAAWMGSMRSERKAKAEKNADELLRLNGWIQRAELAEPFPESDPLADACKKIADSTWSFDRPAQGQKGRMTFHKDGAWETTIPQKGHWIMATEQMVICSFRGKAGDEVFVFTFDEDYRKYEVRAFTDTPTNFVGGQRQR